MYRILALLAALAGASALLGTSCAVPPPEAPALREAVDAAVAPLPHPSLVAGVWRGGRPELFAYRCAPDAIFEIGSVTKVFTARLLERLAAEGKVAFDDPAQRHVPAGWVLPSRDGLPITLAHLATHTSGLPVLPANLDSRDLRNPYADYSDEKLRAFLAGHKLRRRPGERYEYSNLGTGLLGWILARADGRSYEEAVVERICKPLGMSDTRLRLDEAQRRRLAPPHDGGRRGWNWDIPVISGAGALRSTASDVLRFLADNLAHPDATHEPRLRTSEKGPWVGLGWHLSPLPRSGRTMIWHNGATGGYRSFAGFVRESGTAVVLLGNSTEELDAAAIAILDHLQKSQTPNPKPQ